MTKKWARDKRNRLHKIYKSENVLNAFNVRMRDIKAGEVVIVSKTENTIIICGRGVLENGK